jgi:hypothetical protein
MLEEHIIPLAKYNWLILLNSWSILSVCNNIVYFYIFYFICINFSWTKTKSPFYSFLKRTIFSFQGMAFFCRINHFEISSFPFFSFSSSFLYILFNLCYDGYADHPHVWCFVQRKFGTLVIISITDFWFETCDYTCGLPAVGW